MSGPAVPSCGGCCTDGISALLSKLIRRRPSMSQEEFERLVTYLTAVPIFRKQLPRSELPRVAEALRETTWRPGQVVARKGDVGRAFHIIKSGRAAVMLPVPGHGDEESTLLYAMDYFGGHTLVERRTNVATIVARGPEPLVTLSMDKADFEKLGLNRRMTFPTRPAIHDGERADKVGRSLDTYSCGATCDGGPKSPLREEEIEFLRRAVLANQNLRQAFGDEVCCDKVRAFVRGAQRRRVAAGTELARSGDLLQEFYVVASGTFTAVFGGCVDELRSAEESVGHLTKVQRGLRMKERFVRELSVAQYPQYPRRRAPHGRDAFSMRVASASEDEEEANLVANSCTVHSVKDLYRPRRGAPSSFEVGQRVARVVVGESLVREAGTVVEITRPGGDGEALVYFAEPPRKVSVPMRELQPARCSVPIAQLSRGTCYGELSLLYNTRLVTTLRATEDAEVYVLSRRAFKEAFCRKSATLEEHIRLLDDVQLLTPLVRCERWALARSASGVLKFGAGEVVVRQGDSLQERNYLYVVKSGSCVLRQERADGAPGCEATQELSLRTLRRPDCFGERDIFLSLETAEATVHAGPEGLSVLLIHGDILRQFMASIDWGVADMDFAEYLRVAPPSSSCREEARIPFEDLELVRLLGEGGFGSVFLARTADGGEYALKRLSKGYVVRAHVEKQVALEREMLTMVDSDFVVRLFQTYKDKEYVYLLLECCSGGHLFDVMNASKVGGPALLPSSVMFYVGCVTFALEHLHERRIAFRDLKAENVLIDSNGYAKLCDMGFAKFVVDKTYTLLGTPEYMAPETIDTPHGHDHMVDWWALGVLTFELFTGQGPWTNNLGVASGDPVRRMLAIRDSHDDGFPYPLIPYRVAHARDFVGGLLTVSPRRRLGSGGAEAVRRHPWFTTASFDFDALRRRALPAPEVQQGGCAGGERGSSCRSSSCVAADSADSALFWPAAESGSDWDSEF